jgi:hypothetical protein
MVCVTGPMVWETNTILATTQTSVTVLGVTILVSVNLKGSKDSKIL